MIEVKLNRILQHQSFYMKIQSLYFFMIFVLITKPVFSQIDEEIAKQWIYDENERGYNWVPTLLKAKSNSTNSLSQYNGYVFNWIPRGQAYSVSNNIDGINWDSNLNGWNASFSYTGMYRIFHSKGSDENFEYSNEGYSKSFKTNYMTTGANLFKKGWMIHTGFSNNSYVNEMHIQYSTGRFKNGWSSHSFFVFQTTPNGLLPNGFKKIVGGSISIDKTIKRNQLVGFTLWWDHADQGKVSPSVLETYTLTSIRNYNPSWGWLGGQAYYPNHKKTNVPVASIRYEKKWEEKATLQINAGLAVGEQQTSQLDWTSTADPRPDYYRYLPSYSKDSNLRSQLTSWFKANPQALQINFDQITKINIASVSKRSFYIINQNIAKVLLARASLLLKFQLNNYWSGDAGVHFARDQIHYYNLIENLLGGQYYYNYNGWVNDDGVANNFQNDLLYPDRKVKLGEKWGADYEIQSVQVNSWIQFRNINPKWEFSSGFNYAMDLFQRNGFNKNGLFATNSLGSSSVFSFPSLGLKGQFLYKFSGRFYARSILFNQQYAPNASSVFLDPSLHTHVTPFLLPLIKNGIDLSIYYRGVDTKATISAYYSNIFNEAEKRLFYHDRYASFVYGVTGQKETIFQGFEASIETSVLNFMQVEASANFGNYFIANNPLYEILLTNDLYKVESGILRLKKLPAATVPEITQAISLQFQPSFTSRISLVGVYSAKRAISYDEYRRSALVLDPISSDVLYNNIHNVTYLTPQFVLNASMSKSFIIKQGKLNLPIYCNFSLKNLLNTMIPVLVYEQSRFDYVNLNPQKFPLKYLFDPGTTYSLGFQLQIQ